jgi:hypothetical protein
MGDEQVVEHTAATTDNQELETSAQAPKISSMPSMDLWGGAIHRDGAPDEEKAVFGRGSFPSPAPPPMESNSTKLNHPASEIDEEEDDSDESVHLTMNLSESDDESIS